MSLISDFGDLNKDFGLRFLVAAKNYATSPKFCESCIFGPNLEKSEENGHQSRK